MNSCNTCHYWGGRDGIELTLCGGALSPRYMQETAGVHGCDAHKAIQALAVPVELKEGRLAND